MASTAVRTWNGPHTKATVLVTCEDSHTKKLGGRRAEQCSYAIAYQRADGSWSVLGLRSAPKGESGFSGRQDIIPITDRCELVSGLSKKYQCGAQASHTVEGEHYAKLVCSTHVDVIRQRFPSCTTTEI